MHMRDFLDPAEGYVSDDGTAVFSASINLIQESFSTFVRGPERPLGAKRGRGAPVDPFQGRFVWRIESFTKLKELLKKRKTASLCIKSKRLPSAAHFRLIFHMPEFLLAPHAYIFMQCPCCSMQGLHFVALQSTEIVQLLALSACKRRCRIACKSIYAQ